MTTPFSDQMETFLTGFKPRMTTMIANAIAALKIGAANGVATLGSDGKLTTSQIPAANLGALEYQGIWNAATNTPTIPSASSANKGFYFKISTSGTTVVDSTASWMVGDWIVSNGATWDKVDNSELVTSVAGRIGDVILSTADISGLGSVATYAVGDFESPLTFTGSGVSRSGNTVTITGGGGGGSGGGGGGGGGSTTPSPIIYLPLTGENGSRKIFDRALNNNYNNIRCIGSTTQISTAESTLGLGSSLRFNGDGGCLIISGGNQFNFTARNVSISFWVFMVSFGKQQYARFFQMKNGDVYSALNLFFDSYSSNLYYALGSSGSSFDIFIGDVATIPPCEWTHVEYDRDFTDHYLFINGNIVKYLSSNSYLYADSSDLTLGGQYSSSGRSIDAFMSEFLILPYCRNTSNFTPPTTPFM